MPALNQMAGTSYDVTSDYADVVHVVHIYVVEPHPMTPDPSPYRGSVWEAGYSTVAQPQTYGERVTAANAVAPEVDAGQLILVDELQPGTSNNPVWCTYGPCPNCAFLIGQDGVVDTAQTWVNATSMQQAIDQLLQ